jgi:hypothetical protein
MKLEYVLCLLVIMPFRAWAVEGSTVLEGPDVPILETVADDFPRYDLDGLCRTAIAGTGPAAEAARTACMTQQGRLAGLASHAWNQLPPTAREGCVARAERASSKRYSVVYSCVNAARFRVSRKDAMESVAARIARQNGKLPVASIAVGSNR